MKKVIWKKFNERYDLSSLGTMRYFSNKADEKNGKYKYMYGRLNKRTGYCEARVTVSCGKRKTLRLHRMLAKLFIPNTKNKPQINHINGVKTDNRLSNLEWCTKSENLLHAHRIGLKSNLGSRNPRATLTEDQVIEIKNILKNFGPRAPSGLYCRIAAQYKTTRRAIKKIKEGGTWKHVVVF